MKRSYNRKAHNRPSITEGQLRSLVREELSRQILIQEGFLDTIKAPFKKLSDKAKTWVLEKSAELAKKASSALDDLKVPDDIKEFISVFEDQEGGVPIASLVAEIPGASALEDVKKLDFSGMSGDVKTESVDFDAIRMSFILSEEKYAQKLDGVQRLDESAVLSVISTWYAFSKTVITTLGLVIFLLEGGEKLTHLFGMKRASSVFKKLIHFFEKIEDWFLKKTVFPMPVQYAAYLAISGGKKALGKDSEEKVLSYKEFTSSDNKEIREKVVKGLKIALLAVVVVEALVHVVHALEGFFTDFYKSSKALLHSGEHVGIETRNIAQLGAELGKAAETTAGEIRTAASAVGAARQG